MDVLVRPPYDVRPSAQMITRLRELLAGLNRNMISACMRAAVRGYQWFVRPAAAAGLPLLSELLGVRRRGACAPRRVARRLAGGDARVPLRALASRRLRPGALERMDTQRLILLFIFGFSLLMLWEAWEKENGPSRRQRAAAAPRSRPIPLPATPGAEPRSAPASRRARRRASRRGRRRQGRDRARHAPTCWSPRSTRSAATLKRVELLKHKDSKRPDQEPGRCSAPEHHYEAQSGLAGEGGPNHRTLWRAQPGERALAAGPGRGRGAADRARARRPRGAEGLHLQARQLRGRRRARDPQPRRRRRSTPYAYFQLTHDGKPTGDANTVAETFGAQSFIGFAVYTDGEASSRRSTRRTWTRARRRRQAGERRLARLRAALFRLRLAAARQGSRATTCAQKRQDGIYAGAW